MNPNSTSPHLSASDLPAAIRDLAGTVANDSIVSTLGPGITYLIELPSGRPIFFSQTEGAFPNAFFKLLESIETWDELVVETERAAYRDTLDCEDFQRQTRYRILVNRRGETLPVIDYREIVFDQTQKPVAIAGRLVDDSFRSVAFESLSRRSWNEIATQMTRRFLHDFNNTIAGIYSLSELYAEPGSDPKSTAEAMGHIRDCSIRAQDLTRKIRHLTTLESGQESYFDLATLIREQREYMEALLPKGAGIRLQIEDGEHPIRIDANLFRQVILHLTSNSHDACDEDAEIEIRLAQTELHGRPFAILEFHDNGPGFKNDELEQATKAFYTTKNTDKHPGLGLSIASQFAQKYGGQLELANAETGAIVRISLPLLEREKKAEPTAKSAASTSATPPADAPKSSAIKDASTTPTVLIYSWEDISRHPLLLAMQTAGWQTRIHLDAGELLLDLLQNAPQLDGVIVFKSSLDEKADPLVSELSHARGCNKIALITLGESVDTLSVSTKRICGLIASGSSKPSALLSKLTPYFS